MSVVRALLPESFVNVDTSPPHEFYVIGGALKPTTPSYIERAADRELYERVQAGDFCYVLTPRQMGKTSLMARTAQRLRTQGVHCAVVDLTAIGGEKKEMTAAQWYYGVAYRIARELQLQINLGVWWQEREQLPPLQRLTEFFRDIVLTQCAGSVVIFVDEIDSTLPLPFTDDFFAAIRACYNARATDPIYERLTFVLLGVASPTDLAKNPHRTPFNIGQRINLTDFTFDEAQPLAQGLSVNGATGEHLLQRILYWTGGHPYLTQKLCSAAAEQGANNDIDALTAELFFTPQANRNETNLAFVRNHLTHTRKNSRALLKLYRRIRQGDRITDDPHSPLHTDLKLSGVVAPDMNRVLHVRNRIYEQVFTREWATQAIPTDWNRNVAVAAVALLILGFISVRTFYLSPSEVDPLIAARDIETLQTASEDYTVARTAYDHLRTLPGYEVKADELLAEFWDRRARRAAFQENRDIAIVSWLRAAIVQSTDTRRSEVSLLTKDDYSNLLSTYRHGGSVTAIAFSPDGKTILTGSWDKTVRLWRTDTGTPIGSPLRHDNSVLAVAFSPDGQTVLTGSADNTARLWRTDTGAPLGTPLRHDNLVLAVAFSPDGKTVLTGSSDKTARLWRTDTGAPLGAPLRHDNLVLAVAFSPDGKIVLTGSADTTARLWRADTGAPIGSPLRHDNSVRAVAFSPDGKTILTGGDDNTARLWRADTGTPCGTPLRHGDVVRAVAFSPDGKTVLTGSADTTARLWRANTEAPLATPLHQDGSVWAVAFSPDGKTILTGSSNHTARLWRTDTSTPIDAPLHHDDWVWAVAFSPDGHTVLTGSWDTTARSWRADTGAPLGAPLHHGASVWAVAFSPDGKQILTGSEDKTARLWQADTSTPIGAPLRHDGSVRAVAFSPDGKTVLTGSSDHTARLWHADTGKPLGAPLRHDNWVGAVAFSPDGKTVLTGSSDNTVRLWRADTSVPIGSPLRHDSTVRAVAFSPDGKTVLTATSGWLHLSSFAPDSNLMPKVSRLLDGQWTGGYRFLMDNGEQLQLALKETDDSVRLTTLRFDIANAPPMQGDPQELLQQWQQRLALTFNAEEKIVPMWPVEEASRSGSTGGPF